MSIRWPVVALFVAVTLPLAPIRGEDAKSADARSKTASPETEVSVPDLPSGELLKRMEEALSIAPSNDTVEAKMQAVTKALRFIHLGAEKVLGDPKATAEQKREAYHFKISALYQGAKLHLPTYRQQLETLAKQLATEQPKAEIAPLASYLAIKAADSTAEGLGPEALPKIEAFMKNFPGDEGAISLLQELAMTAEVQNQRDFARRCYKMILDAFPKHPTAKMIAGVLRRLDLVGKPFEITGAALDGSPIRTETLKGKVVLIDFWATWCGPCVREFPHLRKLHETYAAKGLEIIGVPLDEDREPLDEFIANNSLPWKQLFFPAEKQSKKDGPVEPMSPNPLAEQYGVGAIPTMFLINRDGVVVSTTVHGEQLDAMLEELLGKAAETASKK